MNDNKKSTQIDGNNLKCDSVVDRSRDEVAFREKKLVEEKQDLNTSY